MANATTIDKTTARVALSAVCAQLDALCYMADRPEYKGGGIQWRAARELADAFGIDLPRFARSLGCARVAEVAEATRNKDATGDQ